MIEIRLGSKFHVNSMMMSAKREFGLQQAGQATQLIKIKRRDPLMLVPCSTTIIGLLWDTIIRISSWTRYCQLLIRSQPHRIHKILRMRLEASDCQVVQIQWSNHKLYLKLHMLMSITLRSLSRTRVSPQPVV